MIFPIIKDSFKYKINETIKTFLLTRDKFMFGEHLKQSQFAYLLNTNNSKISRKGETRFTEIN